MKSVLYGSIVELVKSLFPKRDFIPLHEPLFIGNERKYVLDAIDSTFVSSVGEYVNKFEEMVCKTTGSDYSVAMVNGTNALHIALLLAEVNSGDEVLSQSLTFIATCNAISYIGAKPVFIDIDIPTLGMSPKSLDDFLNKNAQLSNDGYTYNKKSGRRIKACVPMHTYGFPCKIDEIAEICRKWNIFLIEDAAESLGSYYKGVHTGRFGRIGIFSLNGNKTITCGGGGALITNDEDIARKAKHLTTQAKVPHRWAFIHDEIGYNYRMPNLNAAMACAQLEQLDEFVANKRKLADIYSNFFFNTKVAFVSEPESSAANYWLNTILFENVTERDRFLNYSNDNGVMTRPAWELMHRLPMFASSERSSMDNSEWIADRLVNIPSSIRL